MPRNEPWYALNGRLGGHRANLGYLEKREISYPYEDLETK
jgi:hypothetical protein